MTKYKKQYTKGYIDYIGFAADEHHRIFAKPLNKLQKAVKYPLIEWDITEKECLKYCEERGFDWGGALQILSARILLVLSAPAITRARDAEKVFSALLGKASENARKNMEHIYDAR